MTQQRVFYGWATPNSQRVSILLEELGLPYELRPVNIRAREQFAPEILALNPYGKIPILLEPGAPPLFESGAILLRPRSRRRRGRTPSAWSSASTGCSTRGSPPRASWPAGSTASRTSRRFRGWRSGTGRR